MPRVFSLEEERRFYSRHWPEVAQPYLQLEPYLSCWMDAAAIFTGKRVLDIGAGECTYTNLIARRFHARKIIAMDLLHQRMMPAHRANRNLSLHFVSGDCYSLPFPDEIFDVVFGSFVLHHLPDPGPIVREILRVLGPGGCYIGIEPNMFHPVVLCRHLFCFQRYNSANVYHLTDARVRRAFRSDAFCVDIKFFYARCPRLRSRFLGTCMGLMCRKK